MLLQMLTSGVARWNPCLCFCQDVAAASSWHTYFDPHFSWWGFYWILKETTATINCGHTMQMRGINNRNVYRLQVDTQELSGQKHGGKLAQGWGWAYVFMWICLLRVSFLCRCNLQAWAFRSRITAPVPCPCARMVRQRLQISAAHTKFLSAY